MIAPAADDAPLVTGRDAQDRRALPAAAIEAACWAEHAPRAQGAGQRPAASQILGPAPPEILRGPGATVHGQIEDWLAEAIGAGRLAPGDRHADRAGPGRLARGQPDDAAPGAGQARPARAGHPHRRAPGRHVRRRVASWSRTSPPWPGSPSSCAGMGCSRAHGCCSQPSARPARWPPPRWELAEGDPVHEVRRVRLGDGRPIALEHSLFPAALFPGMLRCRLDGSLYELLEASYGQRPCRAGRAWSRSPPA